MSDSESIKLNFPFPIIPQNPGLPNYKVMSEVYSKVKVNAASIASELGGRAHDLIGLTLIPVTYLQLTESTFGRPVNPGTVPTNITGAVVAIVEEARQHKEQLRVFRQVENTELAMKSQIIESLMKCTSEDYVKDTRNIQTSRTYA